MIVQSCYTIPAEVPPGTFEVHLRGEIDLARKPELHQILTAYAESLACHVVVDLGQVTFFDVTGVALLVDLFREARVRGCRFTMRHVPPMTRRIIQIAGLNHLLPEDQCTLRPRSPGMAAPLPATEAP
jgi:anti-sigma B factor antagonist